MYLYYEFTPDDIREVYGFSPRCIGNHFIAKSAVRHDEAIPSHSRHCKEG